MISKAVIDDLYYDSFSRFKKSDLCYESVLNYMKDEDVITKLVSFLYKFKLKKPHYVVLFKLKKSFYLQKMNDNELLKFALKLSRVEGILESYLSKEWKDHVKSFDKTLKDEKKYEKIIQQKYGKNFLIFNQLEYKIKSMLNYYLWKKKIQILKHNLLQLFSHLF